MKISEDTLSILNNFSTVQGSIVINPGSDIYTISNGKNILAKATVDETFPKEFGIYELSEFLSAVSLLEDPSFDFKDDIVEVRSESIKQTIRYGYTDPSLVNVPPNGGKVEFPEPPDLSFILTQDNLKSIKKAAGILNLPHVCIESTGDSLVATVTDKSNQSNGKVSNGFEMSLQTNDEDVDITGLIFCATFSVDNLKLFPGEYRVDVSGQGIGHFINQEIELEYWISSESQYSTIMK